MQSMKPILFSTPMVQAILAGRKTMTRRAIKFPEGLTGSHQVGEAGNPKNPLGLMWVCGIKRPKYQPGDILWVRETWADVFGKYEYRADFSESENAYRIKRYGRIIAKWRPSIFMPREAARIFLRVTDVRVERLRDISVQDAKDEGIKVHANGCKDGMAFGCYNGDDCVYNRCKRPIEYFHELWDSINAKRGYDWCLNPWVFVYEFEKEEQGK